MTADRPSPLRLRALPWLLVVLLVPTTWTAAADTPARILVREYDRLSKFEDFESFTQRMETLRALGKLETPEARQALLRIVRTSKRVDDEVLAIIALGPSLRRETAQELAGFVQRRGGVERVYALGAAYSLASNPHVLKWLAGEALSHKDPGVLLAVLEAQYVHANPEALPRLIELFEAHSERKRGMDLAYAAVRGIGSIGEEEGAKAGDVRRFLIGRAVAHPDYRVRLAAADVMARQSIADLNVRGAIRTLLKDEVPVVREAAGTAVAGAGATEMIPFLADLLDDPHIKTRAVAHRALRKLTGKELGFDADHWRIWFEHRRDDVGPRKATPSTSASTYYGVSVHSDRVLFIVDLSGSMAFPWGTDTTRIDIARAELAQVLEKLDPGTLFNIIVFSDKVRAWRKGEVLATPDTRKRALKWMEKAFKEPRGGTYMHAALEKAFSENRRIDTIFFLTDGLATDGAPSVPEAILASVSSWNRYRRVVIHTIALTLEKLDQKGMPAKHLAAVKKFMRQLARLTGGEAKVIMDVPPK